MGGGGEEAREFGGWKFNPAAPQALAARNQPTDHSFLLRAVAKVCGKKVALQSMPFSLL